MEEDYEENSFEEIKEAPKLLNITANIQYDKAEHDTKIRFMVKGDGGEKSISISFYLPKERDFKILSLTFTRLDMTNTTLSLRLMNFSNFIKRWTFQLR